MTTTTHAGDGGQSTAHLDLSRNECVAEFCFAHLLFWSINQYQFQDSRAAIGSCCSVFFSCLILTLFLDLCQSGLPSIRKYCLRAVFGSKNSVQEEGLGAALIIQICLLRHKPQLPSDFVVRACE